MNVATEIRSIRISPTKFHRIFGKALKVALETTFPVGTELVTISKWDGRNNPEFVYRGSNSLRVYHPAYANGDLSEKESGVIQFIPWVDGTEALYHRLSLRYNLQDRSTWIRMARFGEDSIFDPDQSFVNLDFFSIRSDGFIPIYVKISTKTLSGFTYLMIEGQASDEGASILIKKVVESDVPDILVMARP